MTHVAPEFTTSSVTDTTASACWNINGDTPDAVRIYTDPGKGLGSPKIEHDPSNNCYTWVGLAPGTLYDCNVACVYLDGDEKANALTIRTSGVHGGGGGGGGGGGPAPGPIKVSELRATQVGLHVQLDFFVPPNVESLEFFRTDPGQPARFIASASVQYTHPRTGEPSFFQDDGIEKLTTYTYTVLSHGPEVAGTPGRVESAGVTITTIDPRVIDIEVAKKQLQRGLHSSLRFVDIDGAKRQAQDGPHDPFHLK